MLMYGCKNDNAFDSGLSGHPRSSSFPQYVYFVKLLQTLMPWRIGHNKR